MPKWSKQLLLAALPAAVVVAVCAGTGAAQADDGSHRSDDRPQATMSLTTRLEVRRVENRDFCLRPDGQPVGPRAVNQVRYHTYFVPYDPDVAARMSVWLQRLEGSPSDMRSCPQRMNLSGNWVTTTRNGNRGNQEVHWRQHSASNPSWPGWPSRFSVVRAMHETPLTPGVYRLVMRVDNFGTQRVVKVPFAVLNVR